MKAAKERPRGDGAEALDRPMNRAVLLQRSMCPRFIIIGGVCAEDPAQMRFTDHDHVVEAFPSDRADKSVNRRPTLLQSASNFDPLERRGLTVALAPSELVGVAETA
jgi:hypothetical protein